MYVKLICSEEQSRGAGWESSQARIEKSVDFGSFHSLLVCDGGRQVHEARAAPGGAGPPAALRALSPRGGVDQGPSRGGRHPGAPLRARRLGSGLHARQRRRARSHPQQFRLVCAAFALQRARQCLRSWTAARRSATARGVDQSLPHDENYAAARHQRGKWRHFLFRRWQ